MSDDSFGAEELALDDEALRLLGNAQTVLWDIPQEELTVRERKRLRTISRKIRELHAIVETRVEGENR